MKRLILAASAAFFMSGAQAQECVDLADLAAMLEDDGHGRIVDIAEVPAADFDAIVFYTFDGVIRMNRVNLSGCVLPGAMALAPAAAETNA